MIVALDHVQVCVRRLLLLSGGCITLLCMLLYIVQNKMMYIPIVPGGKSKNPENNPVGRRHPTEVGLPCEDVYVTTADGVMVHGWFLKQAANSTLCPTIFIVHGNSGNIGHRIPAALKLYTALKCNILMIDYRGFGKSEGVASEAGLVLDVHAFLTVDLNIDRSRLVLQGRSLGGAVCIAVASMYPDLVRAMIIENTFVSIPFLVAEMPLVGILRHIFLVLKWNSAERAPLVKCPVLLISGDQDRVTPPSHMKKLYDLMTRVKWKRLVQLEGTHSTTHRHSAYMNTLKSFLKDALPEVQSLFWSSE